ncbi:unnamed protein product, partial [Ixodes hexagonus]
ALARSKSRNLSEKKRRDQFNMLINELCSMVSTSARKMDKSTVLRSTIAFLRAHNDASVQSQAQEGQENWKPSFLSNEEFTHLMLESLEGFLLVLSLNGQILYTSESVASLLGHLPRDLHNIFILDVLHESDHGAICELLSAASSQAAGFLRQDDAQESYVSLDVYMKRGNLGLTELSHVTYELVNIRGTCLTVMADGETRYPLSMRCGVSGRDIQSERARNILYFIFARLQTWVENEGLLGELQNGFRKERRLEDNFNGICLLSRRAPPIIGYLPFEVLGTSGYDYYHVEDLDKVAAGQEALMQTGEGTSCQYRFLTKGQQWIWLQTRYYITYHQWSSKPEFVVCTHTVMSGCRTRCEIAPLSTLLPMHQCTAQKRHPRSGCDPTNLASPQCTRVLRGKALLQNEMVHARAVGITKREVVDVDVQSERNETRTGGRRKTARPVNLRERRATADIGCRSATAYRPPCSSKLQLRCSRGGRSGFSRLLLLQTCMCAPDFTAHGCLRLRVTGYFGQMLPPGACLDGDQPSPHSEHSSHHQSPRQSGQQQQQQTQFQDYLRRRHQALQQQILRQQEELRRVSEQLMLVHFINPNLAAAVTVRMQ